MAKNNKHRPSGFDKFKQNTPGTIGVTTLPVEEDDEADIAEPTDPVLPGDLPPVPPDPNDDSDTGEFAPPPVIRPGVPGGAYNPLDMELASARTVGEQEAIIAAHHPNIRDTMADPAVHYKRALTSGREVPVLTVRSDADPLLVEAKNLIERLVAGGLIVPGVARTNAVDLLLRIVDNITEKPSVCAEVVPTV